MKYCTVCGSQLADGAAVCPTCGNAVASKVQAAPIQEQPYAAPVQEPTPVVDSAPQQPYAQPQYAQPQYAQPQYAAPVVEDKASGGLKALCFFFPIVGLILYILKKNETPNAAKAYLKMAIISWVIAIVVSIISVVISFAVPFVLVMLEEMM